MRSPSRRGGVARQLFRLLLAVGLVPGTALARETVALSPMLIDSSVTPDDRLGVHQVLASELDFAPEILSVVELTSVPSGLDDWCLTNARCLQGISAANGATGFIGGRIRGAGSSLVLDLVYFSDQRIVRRKAFTVPKDPSGLASSMTAVIREVLTGVNPVKIAAAAPKEHDFVLEAEDFELDPVSDTLDDAERALLDDEIDASAISFGSVTLDEISIQALPEAAPAQSASRAASPTPSVPAAQPSASRLPPSRPGGADTAEDRSRTAAAPVQRSGSRSGNRAVTRTAPRSAPRTAPARSTPTVARPRPEAAPRHVRIATRGGYSRYFRFDFVTGGAEAMLRAGRHLDLLVGLEVYAVNRVLPPDVAIQRGVYSEWDTIFPINAGLLYRFDAGALQPYIGADAIAVQYYRDDVGGDWAGGARARLGLDYMVTPGFGLNLNLAAGAWTGQNWGVIEQGVGQSGFLPQVSAGALFAF